MIIFACIISLFIVNLAPYYIKKEEINVLSSCQDLDLEKVYTKSYIAGSIFIIAPQLLLFIFSYEYLYQAIFIMLGIAAYFDFKRNWIPDPVIFITIIINFLYIIHSQSIDLKSICLNSVFFTTPYLLLNALSFAITKKYIFYSGDIYIIISLSFSVLPLLGFITTALSIFSALLFMLITKKREIPYIPFLLISFLASHIAIS